MIRGEDQARWAHWLLTGRASSTTSFVARPGAAATRSPARSRRTAPSSADSVQLDRDGAQLFRAAIGASEVAALLDLLELPPDRPGARLGAVPGLAARLAPADAIAAAHLGPAARLVGARLFDKSAARNWALGWHQDRTIPVRERREVPGFGQWTLKAGIPHCVPPFDCLARSLTLRVHLDAVAADNAPLLIAPGSHRLGPVAEADIEAAVARCGARACLAEAGDVWAYATPILHASGRAARPARRRVLQLLYSADALPGGLEWPVLR